MRTRPALPAALAVGVLVLAGCGSDDDGGTASGDGGAAVTSAAEESASAPSSSRAAGEALLSTADTGLGTIVVDGQGMTVYVFDRDTPGSGTSACSGECLQAWPPVVAESEDPAVEGVTGEVGTIPRDDGTLQVTLEGRPLYHWQDDAAPGDTTGQGVNEVWWVVMPDGTKVTATAPAAVGAY